MTNNNNIKTLDLVPVNVPALVQSKALKWYGEGVDIESNSLSELGQKLVDANLNWTTLKEVMNFHNSSDIVPEHFALRRSDNGNLLDVVGKQYKPINNIDAFTMFKIFMESGDVTLDTVGQFKGGKYVWGMAKLKHEITLKNPKTGEDDKTVGYMMLSNPHVQGQSFVLKLITKRIVCWNTFVKALREDTPSIKINHRNEFNQELVMQKARLCVQSCNESLSDLGRDNQKLLNFSLSFEESLPILRDIYSLDHNANVEDSRVLKALDWSIKNMAGKVGNTAYDVLNAVTYYNTHYQGRNEESRFYNSVLGSQATINNKVQSRLLEIA